MEGWTLFLHGKRPGEDAREDGQVESREAMKLSRKLTMTGVVAYYCLVVGVGADGVESVVAVAGLVPCFELRLRRH